MSTMINTNVFSLNAQRNLAANSASLGTTIQRLSSGLRINSAKDDAAGLAISERFTSQIRGINQAARNANDGISLAQTAEGALAEVTNNLQRIRELAVQASNGTNSQSDRDALNKEVTQLKNEIQRVAEQTSFNGVKLLDGSFTDQQFQVGANVGETITIASIANVQIAALGGTVSRASVSFNVSDITNAGATTALADGDVTIEDASGAAISIGAIAAAANPQERAGQIVEAINRVSGQTGIYASLDLTSGTFTLTSSHDITIAFNGAGSLATTGMNAATTNTTNITGVVNADVSSFANAQQTLDLVDKALNSVNSSRADLGAIQNRFSSVISNLSTMSENLNASRSRIRDTDFAKETAELTRTQILTQAGTAMLAQANQVPQNVLTLLR